MDTEKSFLRDQLKDCFLLVFPALSDAEIYKATPRTVKQWDSIAAIMLVNTIEERFGFTIDYEDLAELDSFEAIAAYLSEHKND